MRGYRGIKYTLFVCCYVFWVVSAVLIAVGIYAKIAKEKDVVDTLTLDPALLLMVLGAVMFLITLLGCVGALRNAACLLKTVRLVLTRRFTDAIFVLLFTVRSRLVPVRGDPDGRPPAAGRRRGRGVPLHGHGDGEDGAADDDGRRPLQRRPRPGERHRLHPEEGSRPETFQCCGVEGYRDWSRNVYFECVDSNPSLESCGVPFSCCVRLQNQTVLNTMCGYGMQQLERTAAARDVFTTGCLEKIVAWARNNLLLVAALTGGLLLLEVCMIALAAAQISRIKKVRRLKTENAKTSGGHRKDSGWFPAFADFDED